MAATSASISDDWEHVDDEDSFSVISLSMSDDDTPKPPQNRPAISALSGPPDNLVRQSRRPPFQSLLQSDAHSREISKESEKDRTVERYGMDTTDVIEPDTPRAQPRAIVNNDSDFDFICATTSSLVKLISAMSSGSCYGATDIKTIYATLGSRLCRLQDILRGYSKHRTPRNGPAELPVGLLDWLGRLELELLSIQETLNDPTTQSQASQANDYYEKLEGFSSQMDGLMNVIQSDYEDFYTLNMPILEDSYTTDRRGHGRSFSRITSGNNNLAHLRRELYTLRDQIVACLGEIRSCQQDGILSNQDQLETMKSLTLSYKKIKESLELMLSNHGSDWIDYSQAGGLTYPEFCHLNPDTIRSLILQLKEVADDLFLERSRVQSIRWGNDPDGILRDEKMIVEESSMNTLRTIEEVLVSILQLHNNA
ncbi:hypothetical protein GGR58DRAFT_481910 [Xylaria digitata]|nr:hypothetical protein GGR58DRAFT_481910 [Xylaria digitata]